MMVFPHTKKIIQEAGEKYRTFENYYNYLKKKTDAFCRHKQEKRNIKGEIVDELLLIGKERQRLRILETRNVGVESSSSRNAELDHEEIVKIEETIQPTMKKIDDLWKKIDGLNLDRDKKTLLEEIDVCQGLFEEVVWKLYEAQFYETAQEAETIALNEEYFKLSSEERKLFMIPDPEKGGKDLEEWNKLSWKSLAEQKFAEFQTKYFRNLEKILKSQTVTES